MSHSLARAKPAQTYHRSISLRPSMASSRINMLRYSGSCPPYATQLRDDKSAPALPIELLCANGLGCEVRELESQE